MALEKKFTWIKGQKVWYDDLPLIEKRAEDFLKTREHTTIKKLRPEQWGSDGAAS